MTARGTRLLNGDSADLCLWQRSTRPQEEEEDALEQSGDDQIH